MLLLGLLDFSHFEPMSSYLKMALKIKIIYFLKAYTKLEHLELLI